MANRRFLRTRLAGALALAAFPCLIAGAQAGAAHAAVPLPSFAATGSADGARVTVDIPGAILEDKLVDVGGPTAQVDVSTLGTSTGYAAFPDPGGLVNSAPGLVVGLVSQGAYGLPPVKLPTLPALDPLEVHSDATGQTDSTLGTGPYKIDAHSQTTTGSADATGGLDNVTGSAVAGLSSHATVTNGSDGSVTVTATSDIRGLQLGPLIIGSITSSASETLKPDGSIVPSSSTQILALSVAGIPVTINSDGLGIGGSGEALPIGDLLNKVLSLAKVTIQFNQVTTTPGTVVAPVLELSTPFRTDLGSTGMGTFSLAIGGTSVTMTGSPVEDDSGPSPVVTGSTGLGGTTTGLGGVTTPVTGLGSVPAPSVVPGVTTPSAGGPVSRAVSPRAEVLLGQFNIRSMYLVFVGLALAVLVLGQLVRLLGVRN